MSRSGYVDDYDCGDNLQMGRWRGMVASASRGKRGQVVFKEMLAAMDAMMFARTQFAPATGGYNWRRI